MLLLQLLSYCTAKMLTTIDRSLTTLVNLWAILYFSSMTRGAVAASQLEVLFYFFSVIRFALAAHILHPPKVILQLNYNDLFKVHV